MTEWTENPNDSEGIKALRKKFKEQGQKLAEMEAALARTMEREKTQNVYEALANRGLDPRVAKFYPKDAATDDAAVDEWVTENGELFGSRRVIDDKQPNPGTLTDAEMRGYQIQKDIGAYEGALQMDLKSRMDKIQYDPNNPEKAQNELIEVLKEFDGVLNA
jgi:hypothetical protein